MHATRDTIHHPRQESLDGGSSISNFSAHPPPHPHPHQPLKNHLPPKHKHARRPQTARGVYPTPLPPTCLAAAQ